MKSQASFAHLQGVRAESAHQAQEADRQRQAATTDSARCH